MITVNNQFLTTTMCSFPILAGVMAAIFFSKADTEKRIRNALWWSISAISIPWLSFVWQSEVKTPQDVRVFGWSLLIYLPIWLLALVLAYKGERYKKISQLLLLVAVLPILIYVFSDFLDVMTNRFSATQMKLIVSASIAGIFWVLGLWARDYEIILSRDR